MYSNPLEAENSPTAVSVLLYQDNLQTITVYLIFKEWHHTFLLLMVMFNVVEHLQNKLVRYHVSYNRYKRSLPHPPLMFPLMSIRQNPITIAKPSVLCWKNEIINLSSASYTAPTLEAPFKTAKLNVRMKGSRIKEVLVDLNGFN